MEEFLKRLGITDEGLLSDDGTYVIEIPDSNKYAKYYSILERTDIVEEDESSSQLTSSASSIQYSNELYTITLMSDFDEDIYRLTIKEI